MLKNKVYYIMGVSGCGKSTIGMLLAKELKIPFYDGDDYHPQKNIDKMSAGIALNDTDRKPWLQKINTKAKEEINKKGCVIACSALKDSYRKIISESIQENVLVVYLKGDYETIYQRMQARNHFMPPELLQSQFKALEEPKKAIVVEVTQLPNAIIDFIKNTAKQV